MRRIVITLLAAFPLTLGAAAASARPHPRADGSRFGPMVSGSVVSTDATDASFVASVVVPSPGGGGTGSGGGLPTLAANADTTTQVTVTTDGRTRIRVNGRSGGVADMSAGDNFVAQFRGGPKRSLTALVSQPAAAVVDRTPRQLFAFVGNVTGVDTAGGTITVAVSRSLPANLVPAGSPPVTFTVSPTTLILGGSGGSGLFGGSLATVSNGDLVAGGLVGRAGETLDQVQDAPLQVLLDLPAPAGSGGGVFPTVAKASALGRALKLLGAKGVKHSHGHRRHGHKRHRRGHRNS